MSSETPQETEQRPVEKLLELSTYQGMSDAEIQSIIEYTLTTAINDIDFAERYKLVSEKIKCERDYWAQQTENANAALNEIVASAANPTYITYDGAVVNEQPYEQV